ncbi:ORF43 [Ranid herpesvirus 2]|uniref:ORF43 n=1 Tax=Ranid herpesvirus 2 TaxID=389214 RepID=Q14W63_9VIRU|nr:ORF43 [Ranid herpesvirus 2]ABG25584.1 ORF43 [Ranid herpesvirus 2]
MLRVGDSAVKWSEVDLNYKAHKKWQSIYALDYKPNQPPDVTESGFLNSCRVSEESSRAVTLPDECFLPGAVSYHMGVSAGVMKECKPVSSIFAPAVDISMRNHMFTVLENLVSFFIARRPREGMARPAVAVPEDYLFNPDFLTEAVAEVELDLSEEEQRREFRFRGQAVRGGAKRRAMETGEDPQVSVQENYMSGEEGRREFGFREQAVPSGSKRRATDTDEDSGHQMQMRTRDFGPPKTREEVCAIAEAQFKSCCEHMENLEGRQPVGTHPIMVNFMNRFQIEWGKPDNDAMNEMWRLVPEVNVLTVKCLPLLTGHIYADLYAVRTMQHMKRYFMALSTTYIFKIYPTMSLTKRALCDTGFDILLVMADFLDDCDAVHECMEIRKFYIIALLFQQLVLKPLLCDIQSGHMMKWFRMLNALHSYCEPDSCQKVTSPRSVGELIPRFPELVPVRAIPQYMSREPWGRMEWFGHDVRFVARFPKVAAAICDAMNTIDYVTWRGGSGSAENVATSMEELTKYFDLMGDHSPVTFSNLPAEEKYDYDELSCNNHTLTLLKAYKPGSDRELQRAIFLPPYTEESCKSLMVPQNIVKGEYPFDILHEVFPEHNHCSPCPTPYSTAINESTLRFNPSYIDVGSPQARGQIQNLYRLFNLAFCPGAASQMQALFKDERHQTLLFDTALAEIYNLGRVPDVEIPDWWLTENIPEPSAELCYLWSCLKCPYGTVDTVMTGDFVLDWPSVSSWRAVCTKLANMYNFALHSHRRGTADDPCPLLVRLIHDIKDRKGVSCDPLTLKDTKLIYLKLYKLCGMLDLTAETSPGVILPPRSVLHVARLLQHSCDTPFLFTKYLFHEAAALNMSSVYGMAKKMARQDFDAFKKLAFRAGFGFGPEPEGFDVLHTHAMLADYLRDFFSLYPKYPGELFPLDPSYHAVVRESTERTQQGKVAHLSITRGIENPILLVSDAGENHVYIDFFRYRQAALEETAAEMERMEKEEEQRVCDIMTRGIRTAE